MEVCKMNEKIKTPEQDLVFDAVTIREVLPDGTLGENVCDCFFNYLAENKPATKAWGLEA